MEIYQICNSMLVKYFDNKRIAFSPNIQITYSK